MSLEAIKFNRETKSLEILDQLQIPYSTKYIPIESIEDAYQAIKKMQVRGAPAIAIVGAFAIVVEISKNSSADIGSLLKSIDHLVESRPTAVNLYNACSDIQKLLGQFNVTHTCNEAVLKVVYDYAIKLYDEDLANNFKIGANGLQYIIDTLQNENFKGPFSIMTICNTGSLATSGHGTALGIIRTVYKELAQKQSNYDFYLEKVYPCETRPYNQGAKLTTYELKYENIPFTLICDNMATSLINTLNIKSGKIKESAAPVKFIIVGADRVVQNGDTANKIGTFQLSAIADFHNRKSSDGKIKFIVAAPKTTIDFQTKSGDDIIIEERPANELTTLKGPSLDENGNVGEKITVGVATPGIEVWNPAFDVTPHELIDAIVTEDSLVFTKDSTGNFNLK